MIQQKHNVNSLVTYIGAYKNSYGHQYIITKTHRRRNGTYVYDAISYRKPVWPKDTQHAEQLCSLEYNELRK